MLPHGYMTAHSVRHERYARIWCAAEEDGGAAALDTGSSTMGSVRRPKALGLGIDAEGGR